MRYFVTVIEGYALVLGQDFVEAFENASRLVGGWEKITVKDKEKKIITIHGPEYELDIIPVELEEDTRLQRAEA